jgi:hypothetical protein
MTAAMSPREKVSLGMVQPGGSGERVGDATPLPHPTRECHQFTFSAALWP